MNIENITLPLFLPAVRMDRLAKAVGSGADAIIFDLEDAVGPDDKDTARALLVETLGKTPVRLPVLVRINAQSTPWYEADILACADLPIDAVVLPKAETADACHDVSERTGKPVIALIETALGMDNAKAIAGACRRLAFGSIDYAADLGIAHMRDSLLHARATLVLAARLAGQTGPLDGVTTNIKDAEVITSDSQHSVSMGFGGKLLIHPAQVQPSRTGFAPSQMELDWAHRVLEAASGGAAAVQVDGAMVDAPVLKRAGQVISRAGG
ncbi:CoA ester lyase [Sulfitobacter sp.]|uniref:HpcH/HpaI aldolase/citrate lyase family protein n=1 Tax=Sulfitobacter sp. TaxID=1903071 RepID=UPI00356A1692